MVIQDSLDIVNNMLEQNSETDKAINFWIWIAILELGIIIFLLLKDRLKPKETAKQKFKNESLKQDVDFNNIINSSFNSNQLYDELKIKCHPDKFPTDKNKNAIAESLFQEISKNKTNVKRLLELKEDAKQKLNINF